MTTSKQFNAIAEIVSELGAEWEEAASEVAFSLANLFGEENPRFDRERFIDACEPERLYNVERIFEGPYPPERIKSDLTLEEAQAHCRDPETSSSTATSADAFELLQERGPWFDSYEQAGGV